MTPGHIAREPFGMTEAGRPVEALTLTNALGMEVRCITYGGAIVSLKVPDRHGVIEDVTLGYDSLEAYVADRLYMGTLIGRFANRIGNGRFTLDGVQYALSMNDGPNHLHGGSHGFHKVLWSAEPVSDASGVRVALSYTSPAGEEGYPGTLDVRVTYTVARDENALTIDYLARCDEPTLVNLTQHSYFNLAGEGKGGILDHEMLLNASHFTPVDAGLIPTGEIRSVAGTPFDFTTPTTVGARIDQVDEQLGFGGGYDHNFILDRQSGNGLFFAARLSEPASGRTLDILTTEPGVQFFSGNGLDFRRRGKRGHVYSSRSGLAIETQHFPDSPNQAGFPSAVLRPGEEYRSTTVYRFSVDAGRRDAGRTSVSAPSTQ